MATDNLGRGVRLVWNDDAFSQVRTGSEVSGHVDGIARELSGRASDRAQAHGGGRYGWSSETNSDRHTAVVFTDDAESALDSALHSTLYQVAAEAEGMG